VGRASSSGPEEIQVVASRVASRDQT
jgi:hypothetical protein